MNREANYWRDKAERLQARVDKLEAQLPPPPIGEALRDDALDKIESKVSEEWKEKVGKIIRGLALTRQPFTSDEVWAGIHSEGLTVHDNRALGPMMMKASRSGIVVKTGRTRTSKRPETHASPKAEWVGII